MRADRLVATLLLLQARGRVTAGEVAEALEVSERTARRDLEALSMAGIPVYSQQGRGGGWSLIGGARTDLSGLSAPEARALFLVAGPQSPATPELKAALRKLVQALPEPLRKGAEAAAGAIVVDPSSWDGTGGPPPPPQLIDLQQAVVDGVQVRLGYTDRVRNVTERVVHPLGVVVKNGVWYLVANTDAGLRTFRVNRVQSTVTTGDPVVRPEGFDLAAAWATIKDEVETKRTPYRTRVRADKNIVGPLYGLYGNRMKVVGSTKNDRVEVEIRMHSPWAAATEIAGFGNHVEALDPEVRQLLAQLARDIAAVYAND